MGERLVGTETLEVESTFVARLLMGALSEHEQRLVGIRLLSRDATFREAFKDIVASFEMFDLPYLAEYAEVLRGGQDVEIHRQEILHRATEITGDLSQQLHEFTFVNAMQLDGVMPRLFTWTMAEHLLERTRRVGANEHEIRTHLYLAMMMIDVVEMLGSAGHSPPFPTVVSDVRKRIHKAASSLGERPSAQL